MNGTKATVALTFDLKIKSIFPWGQVDICSKSKFPQGLSEILHWKECEAHWLTSPLTSDPRNLKEILLLLLSSSQEELQSSGADSSLRKPFNGSELVWRKPPNVAEVGHDGRNHQIIKQKIQLPNISAQTAADHLDQVCSVSQRQSTCDDQNLEPLLSSFVIFPLTAFCSLLLHGRAPAAYIGYDSCPPCITCPLRSPSGRWKTTRARGAYTKGPPTVERSTNIWYWAGMWRGFSLNVPPTCRI